MTKRYCWVWAAFAVAICATSVSGCSLGGVGRSHAVPNFNAGNLTPFENSQQPYYYVGRSFDGLRLQAVQRYIDASPKLGVASFIYGTCDPPADEGGCPAPLELQHRMCHGQVTVVIYVGADPKPGRAGRAARALRPLSDGARRVPHPPVTFDQAPAC